ncbi:MAG: serine/threonine protein kinase [Deltaproteobacteria bacterium]|nr:serine/threonine protein kinase [Deltaproteobacteria bacterium]
MSAPLQPGDRLAERYALERRLGVGAMGEVWLARDERLARAVAVKRLRHDIVGDVELGRRFVREARATARLDHPHIVPVHDLGESAAHGCFLVMEYVDGLSLEQVLRAGLLDAEAARALLQALAAGLAHAHAAGVLHRDLKPANVLCPGGQPAAARITDFGLAKIVAEGHSTLDLTQRGTLLGTPAYMSPEQARGDEAGFAADVYTWGCIAYEVLTGKPPFEGRTGEVLRAHTGKAPELLSLRRPGVAPELEAIVMRALAKVPAARFADGRALLLALGGPAAARLGSRETVATSAGGAHVGGQPGGQLEANANVDALAATTVAAAVAAAAAQLGADDTLAETRPRWWAAARTLAAAARRDDQVVLHALAVTTLADDDLAAVQRAITRGGLLPAHARDELDRRSAALAAAHHRLAELVESALGAVALPAPEAALLAELRARTAR